MSAPLWASEDLASSSEVRRDDAASRGSPEWSGAADSQRAISLDASECLAEISNPALVRSSALEDLRDIGDKREGEGLVCKETAGGAVSPSRQSLSPKTGTGQGPSVSDSPPFEADSVDADPEAPWKEAPQEAPQEAPREAAVGSEPPPAVNGDRDSAKDHVCRDSEWRAGDVPQSPQSSPARKSLVPVPIAKGLFAVTLTESSALLQFHCFSLQRSFYCVLCCTLPLRTKKKKKRKKLPLPMDSRTRGEACCPPSPLWLLVSLLHRCSLCPPCSPSPPPPSDRKATC